VDKSVNAVAAASAAAAGGSLAAVDVSVDITFEPSSVGESRSVLILSSSAGGDYVFPLQGVCLLPKPQVIQVVISESSST